MAHNDDDLDNSVSTNSSRFHSLREFIPSFQKKFPLPNRHHLLRHHRFRIHAQTPNANAPFTYSTPSPTTNTTKPFIKYVVTPTKDSAGENSFVFPLDRLWKHYIERGKSSSQMDVSCVAMDGGIIWSIGGG
mmetsp:Transcript_17103/g.32564  ORF Transcript_17103/g.32564 Transcript_17103/m.32564 type:complete len:132 (-) Transcript_17103:450-845(-)